MWDVAVGEEELGYCLRVREMGIPFAVRYKQGREGGLDVM